MQKQALQGHEGSVEDIHWAPAEACVFASAGCDGTVRMWDTRQRAGAMLTVKVQTCSFQLLLVQILTWETGLMHCCQPDALMDVHRLFVSHSLRA